MNEIWDKLKDYETKDKRDKSQKLIFYPANSLQEIWLLADCM